MLYERTVTKIEANPYLTSKKNELRQLKVAAYCRVSTDSEDQLQSYEAQVSYYSDYICKNPKWHFVGIYADEGVTGTVAKKRDGFMSMIKDCEKGKIDLILTKSVSRFARNTVDSISYVRKLKAMNIGVFFEEQNLDTLKTDSEMFLGLYSVMAQSESENISANVKWGIHQRMKKGLYASNFSMFGYRKGEDGVPVIVPEEAETIKMIFNMYIDGASTNIIADTLIKEGRANKNGVCEWTKCKVRDILMNEKYAGDLLLQKTFSVDCIGKKKKKNRGEMPQYLVSNNHPAIIDKDTFKLVQLERARRNSQSKKSTIAITELGKYSSKYALTQLLICGNCGAYYRRNTKMYNGRQKVYWRCLGRTESKTKKCIGKGIREEVLHAAICRALNKVMPDRDSVVNNIISTLEYGLSGNSMLEEKNRLETMINSCQAEADMLMERAMETDGNRERYFEEIDKLYSKIKSYREEVKKISNFCESNIENDAEAKRIMDVLKNEEISFSEYNDSVVRKLVDCIRVMPDDSIIVYMKGGKEIKEPLMEIE